MNNVLEFVTQIDRQNNNSRKTYEKTNQQKLSEWADDSILRIGLSSGRSIIKIKKTVNTSLNNVG